MAGLLEMGKELRVERECVKCRRVHVQTIRLSEGEECRQEAFFRNERKNFADLGILPKGAERGTRPTMIIEILHSSATLEENRPDDIPWFEIKAKDVNSQTELFAKDPLHVFKFDCQRKLVCEECVTISPVVDWIRAKDKGTPSDMWNEQYYSKCVSCDSLCEHRPLYAPPGQYDIQNPYSRGPDYLYARHRMCKYHRELMGICDLMAQREFLVGATECYDKRRDTLELKTREEYRRFEATKQATKRFREEDRLRGERMREDRRENEERRINEERRRLDYEAAFVAAVQEAEQARQIVEANRVSEACKAAGPQQLALVKRVLAVARRVAETRRRLADQRIAKQKRTSQEKEADKEQRRLDYEAACVAEKEYYRRKEGCALEKNPVEFNKRRKASALSRPRHQRYLRKNKWIKGMKEYVVKHE
jgi:hypothetical protein